MSWPRLPTYAISAVNPPGKRALIRDVERVQRSLGPDSVSITSKALCTQRRRVKDAARWNRNESRGRQASRQIRRSSAQSYWPG